jgi:hypothetical protein
MRRGYSNKLLMLQVVGKENSSGFPFAYRELHRLGLSSLVWDPLPRRYYKKWVELKVQAIYHNGEEAVQQNPRRDLHQSILGRPATLKCHPGSMPGESGIADPVGNATPGPVPHRGEPACPPEASPFVTT